MTLSSEVASLFDARFVPARVLASKRTPGNVIAFVSASFFTGEQTAYRLATELSARIGRPVHATYRSGFGNYSFTFTPR